MRKSLLVLYMLLALAFQPAAAEERADRAKAASGPGASLADSLSFTSRRDPIHIRSDKLEFFYDAQRIIYRGQVVVTQGEATLKSDLLTLTYEEAGTDHTEPSARNAASRQRIKEIVAEGHVEISSGDQHARAHKAVFNEAKRTIVLSGDALLKEGVNQVTGNRVTVYLDEKRSVVEGGNQQARMVFVPDSQKDNSLGGKRR